MMNCRVRNETTPEQNKNKKPMVAEGGVGLPRPPSPMPKSIIDQRSERTHPTITRRKSSVGSKTQTNAKQQIVATRDLQVEVLVPRNSYYEQALRGPTNKVLRKRIVQDLRLGAAKIRTNPPGLATEAVIDMLEYNTEELWDRTKLYIQELHHGHKR